MAAAVAAAVVVVERQEPDFGHERVPEPELEPGPEPGHGPEPGRRGHVPEASFAFAVAGEEA